MYLEIDERRFSDNFNKKSCPAAHHLTEHPLLTVEAIARLAERLPEQNVEHNLGNLPIVLGSKTDAPRVDQSPGEVACGIETNGCWMVLKNIEADAEYRRLLDDCLDEVAPLLDRRDGAMGRREGFIFLSAPGSVTPAHFDPEHNFLLQIRGEKSMNVGNFPDAEIKQKEVEYRRYHGGGRNIDWEPVDPIEYRLHPGEGVYVPVDMPHWVKVPDNVSVSLSITFYTPALENERQLHRINGQLRRLGLTPRPIGTHPTIDRGKLATFRVLRSVLGLVRRRPA